MGIEKTLKYLLDKRKQLSDSIQSCFDDLHWYENRGFTESGDYMLTKERLNSFQAEWTKVDMCVNELKWG